MAKFLLMNMKLEYSSAVIIFHHHVPFDRMLYNLTFSIYTSMQSRWPICLVTCAPCLYVGTDIDGKSVVNQ